MSEVIDVPEHTTSATRPGRRLTEARKAQNLTLDQVAAQLRLNVGILQALENDDYARLPPAAYVSGYLRSYARLLGLPEHEITGNTVTTGGEPPPIVGVATRSQAAQVQANDPRVRAVTYLVFGGLVFLSAVWWISQREGPAEPVLLSDQTLSAPAQEQPMASPATGEVTAPVPDEAIALATPVPANTPAPVAAAPAASKPVQPVTPAKPAQVVAAKPVTVSPPAVIAPAAPAPVPASADPLASAEPAVDAASPSEPAAPALPPPPPLTAETPQSKVTVEFTAECWAEIIDSAGRTLVYELGTPGRVVTARGEAPFKAFFGYSPGAQVSLNDELFDHRPFQRRNDTARFNLGSVEDNAPLTEAE